MNFYKEAADMLDTIESKKSSIKGCLSLAAAKDRKRLGALIIGKKIWIDSSRPKN
jgi:putative methyltransferase